MTWRSFIQAKKSEGVKDKTLGDYRTAVRRFAAYMAERKGPHYEKIERSDIEAFLASLRGEMSEFRRRNIWVALRSVYTYFEGVGLEQTPMRGVKPPKLPKVIIDIYERDELQSMMDDLAAHSRNSDRDLCMFWVFLDTGVREQELLRIQHRHLDRKRCTIKILGKQDKHRLVKFGQTTRLSLAMYLHGKAVAPTEAIFPTSARRIYEIFRRSCDRCDISRRRPIHTFRHTFACNYLMGNEAAGIPPGSPLDLMYLLGHSTLHMVNHYSQWCAQRRALENYHMQNKSLVDLMTAQKAGNVV